MLDLLIRNARICDGTGAPAFMGELGVKDGLIRSVGPTNGQTAARVIDADGLVLAPASWIPTPTTTPSSRGIRSSPARPGTA